MRATHGNLKIHAAAGQAIFKLSAGHLLLARPLALFSARVIPFPQKQRLASKSERPVDMTGLIHCGRGHRKITLS